VKRTSGETGGRGRRGSGSRRRSGGEPLYAAKHGSQYCAERKLCVECGTKLTGRRTRWCSDDCVNAYLIRSSPTDARKAVFKRDHGRCAACGISTAEVRESIRAADKNAFRAYLEEWNLANPKGVPGYYAEPAPGYTRHTGPKTHVGFSPGTGWPREAGNPRRKRHRPNRVAFDFRNRLWEIVRAHRLACLDRIGLKGFKKWWWRKTWWDCNHIKPVELGGGGCGLENLETLCLPCHLEKTIQQAHERGRRKRLKTTASGATFHKEVAHGSVQDLRQSSEAQAPRGRVPEVLPVPKKERRSTAARRQARSVGRGKRKLERRRGQHDDQEGSGPKASKPRRSVRAMRREASGGTPSQGRRHREQQEVESGPDLPSLPHGRRRTSREVHSPSEVSAETTSEAVCELRAVGKAPEKRKVRSVQRVPSENRQGKTCSNVDCLCCHEDKSATQTRRRTRKGPRRIPQLPDESREAYRERVRAMYAVPHNRGR